MTPTLSASNSHPADWWRGAVVYQIYPRSFMDSNGDGIGDLAGITAKLDYIASLNVDAIWLSPFFTSPMKDFGYDVADYRGIAPMFGTLDDFKQLIFRAHELGLKVIIDQVYSHSSDQHPWFQESRQSRDNPKADWYVWADAKPDGTPPNNWLSLFGGSAWQWDTRRKQYFQHNFLSSQPDLNFHNPEVQQAVLDTARYWLELGVDGFRLDVVNMYFHNADLSDNPVVTDPVQQFVGIDKDNPFCRQYHINQMCRDDNLPFLQKLRSVLDEFPGSTTVGEIGAPDGMSYMAQYTSGGDKLHMAYTFELLGNDCDAGYIRSTLQRVEQKLGSGWPSFALSNHDVVRSATRWAGNSQYPDKKIRAMLALLTCSRGTPCLYQGEELGLPEADVPFEALQDPFGIEFWPEFKGRDGCRTPMAWQDDPMLGFTQGSRSWLPCEPAHRRLSVAQQQADSDSMLNYVRDFLAMRRQHSALATGTVRWLTDEGDILHFERQNERSLVRIAINMSEQMQACDIAPGAEIIWGDAPADGKMQPYQVLLYR